MHNRLNMVYSTSVAIIANNNSNGLFYRTKVSTYKSSTFLRAQGVLRKKVKLDLIVGLLLKQLIRTNVAKSCHP